LQMEQQSSKYKCLPLMLGPLWVDQHCQADKTFHVSHLYIPHSRITALGPPGRGGVTSKIHEVESNPPSA